MLGLVSWCWLLLIVFGCVLLLVWVRVGFGLIRLLFCVLDWLLDACISVSAGICGVLMACFSWLRMLVWAD